MARAGSINAKWTEGGLIYAPPAPTSETSTLRRTSKKSQHLHTVLRIYIH